MTASKTKHIDFYHPTLNSDTYNFSFLLRTLIDKYGSDGKTVPIADGENLVVSARTTDGMIIICAQALKSDELPKVANESDGKDERNLEVPSGKSLSYKNIFIYSTSSNLLVTTNLSACPRVGKLKMFLKILGKEEGIITKDSDLAFLRIMDRGLVERLKQAKSITMAQFTSKEYYGGDSIDERNFEKYKEFLAGKNFEKTTKLRGKKGENIKNIVQFILDDIIGNHDMPDLFSIRMNIDGEPIDFQRYYKKYPLDVQMDRNNHKYVDYVDLEKRLIEAMNSYRESYEN